LVKLHQSEIEEIVRLHHTSGKGRSLGLGGMGMFLARSIGERTSQILQASPPAASQGFFFKLSTRSAKDSCFYKEQKVMSAIANAGAAAEEPLSRCQARTTKDIVSAMIGSERIGSDCDAFLKWKVKPEKKRPLYLVLQPWLSFPAKHEFRCWVFAGEVKAINPVAYTIHIPSLEDESVRNDISDAAEEIVATTHALLPWPHYILDIIYDEATGRASICEYNPWGPHSSTGSQLFSWEMDRDILFGPPRPAHKKPEFRVLRPGMKMGSMFDLYLHRKYFEPSETFLRAVQEATQECPCCPREGSAVRPETQVVPFAKRLSSKEGGSSPPVASAITCFPCVRNNSNHPLKMALLVRDDLNMGKGKMACQCSHASIGCFQRASALVPTDVAAWLATGQLKVALSVFSSAELADFRLEAGSRGIPYFMAVDAGRTQLKEGTKSVLAIGPAPSDIIDSLCGRLSLHE
jgi:PTH2 family peptidyl-tRNA hydrolase